VALHDSDVVADGGTVTLLARVQVRPAGLEAETDRPTVWAEPVAPVTVIVEVPDAPTFTSAGLEAAMVKVSTVKEIMLVVWVSGPLVPVTVAV
jgi:hypothetical protein